MSSDEEDEELEYTGEGGITGDLPPIPGEGAEAVVDEPPPPPFVEEVIVEKKLDFAEASRCLNTLGKDESGVRYAYLMMSPVERKLTDVSIILHFKHVLFLDVSGNYLELDALQVISDMPFLVYVRADRNRLEGANLKTMQYLQTLALNRNLIADTSTIIQPTLEVLELEYNAIQTIDFDKAFTTNVLQLDLRGNYLTDISGSYPPALENLYLAENKIRKFDPSTMELFKNLQILHLRNNAIRKLNGFVKEMEHLKYLNLRQNNISKHREFRKLECLPNLETLIIIHNPIAGDPKPMEYRGEGFGEEEEDGEGPEDLTRVPIIMFLPHLKRLNKQQVLMSERERAIIYKEEHLQDVMAEESDVDVFDDDYIASSTEAGDYGGGEGEGEGEEEEEQTDEETEADDIYHE